MAKILTFLLLLGKLSSHTGQILGQHKFYFVVLKTRWGDILFLRLLLLFWHQCFDHFWSLAAVAAAAALIRFQTFFETLPTAFSYNAKQTLFYVFFHPKIWCYQSHLDNKSSLGIVMEFVWNNIYARVCSFDLNKFFSVSDVFCKIGSLIASF